MQNIAEYQAIEHNTNILNGNFHSQHQSNDGCIYRRKFHQERSRLCELKAAGQRIANPDE
jgi:hypothetical protein